MARRLAALVVVAAYSMGSPTLVAAQAATATLSGVVVDQTDAVLDAARVVVVNVDNGLQRASAVDGDGRFVLALLPPGRYRLTAESFKRYVPPIRGATTPLSVAVAACAATNVGDPME